MSEVWVWVWVARKCVQTQDSTMDRDQQVCAGHLGGIMYGVWDVYSRHHQRSARCELPLRPRLSGLTQCGRY